MSATTEIEHLDVLIIGAGLSGIGAAYHLQDRLPGKSYAILEARGASGGTWDLFRYPGIRSDSDMHTLGYRFRPWPKARAIADGPSILDYVRDTARENRIDERIRFHHRIERAEWSTPEARWTVIGERTDTGEEVRLSCSFLLLCSGYFNYEHGYTPDFPGAQRFAGRLVHPQFWPEDLDHAGKRVVVIGSGATAVTLVPALAETAARVTMLQRSPTWIVSMPGVDPLARAARRWLPERLAYLLIRWKNVLLTLASFQLSRRRPEVLKRILRKGIELELPANYDIDTHFTPRYDPWDQRLCLVPDGDLFAALRGDRAEVVTDTIETFTETGIRLSSGRHLEADVVVTATGLDLLPLGGIELTVDGAEVSIPDAMAYKALMLGDVPNLAFAVGYTNASWTLKADLTCEYVCRLLSHMDEHGHTVAVPRRDPAVAEAPFLDFTSGYVLRSLHRFPKQGARRPWRLRQNYAADILALRHGAIEDGVMAFSTPVTAAAAAEPVAQA